MAFGGTLGFGSLLRFIVNSIEGWQAHGARGEKESTGNGSQGDITLMHTKGQKTIHLDGGEGNIKLGGGGAEGDLALVDGRGQADSAPGWR